MKHVILPLGISGSGKSTWVKSLTLPNLEILSPDEMRISLLNNINDKSNDAVIYEVIKYKAGSFLIDDKTVLIDSTNLQKERRRNFIRNMQLMFGLEVKFFYKLFEADVEVSEARIMNQIRNNEYRAYVNKDSLLRQI